MTPECEQLEIKIAPATFNWTGLGANNLWSNSVNWGGTAPTSGAGADLVFPAGAAQTLNLDDVNGGSFSSITIGGTGYNIFGYGATLSNGIMDSDSTPAGDSSLDIPITMNPGSNSFPIQMTGAGTLHLTGGLFGDVSQGGLAISGPGTGVLALDGAGADTYTGPTTLSSAANVELNKAGTNAAIPGDLVIYSGSNLTVLNDNQIGDTSTVTLENSTLDLSAYSDTINDLFLSGTGAASVQTGLGTLSVLGNVGALAEATIDGNLNLATGTHMFSVVSDMDLIVNATVGGLGDIYVNDGGTLTLTAANSYVGTTEVAYGTLITGIAGALPATTALTVDPSSTVELAGFSQTVSSLSGSGNGLVDLGSSGSTTLTVGDATDTTFAGVIEGAGGLTKQGTGALTLSGVNTFAGATDITAGTLMVNGSLAAASVVTVGSGSTLGGSGTLGNVSNWGTIAPGNASNTGVLTVDSVVFETGSFYQVTLATPTYGVLSVGGTADFSGATLNAYASSGFTPTVFSALTLVQNSSGSSFDSSPFVNLADNSYLTIGGNSYLSNYDYSVFPHSDDVVLINVQNTTTIVQSSNLNTTYGDSVTFTAIVSGGTTTPAGTVEFWMDGSQVTDGTLSPSGTATWQTSALNAGGHQISAFYEGDAQHGTSTSEHITQSVAKATPLINWGDPSDITYGTVLSVMQLNAIVTGTGPSPTGALTYTPAAGTILNAAADQTLQVDVAATSNYNAASQDVSINVLKASAIINITPYSVTYDGTAHTAMGTATGVESPTPVDLSSLLNLSGTTHTAAGAYATDAWTFAGNGNYSSTSGTTEDVINKANATINVTPYTVTYDATAHTATGTATGVESPTPVDLSGLLNLSGTTHTTAGVYATDAWRFAGNGNYNSTSGTIHDVINKATATIDVTPYSVNYDGTAHTATGTATGVNDESLSGLNLSGTTHTSAGNYGSDNWTFRNPNYQNASGTVGDVISKVLLTVTANNASRPFGQPNPAFTASYSGFVPGETLITSGVTGSPSLTTTATQASPASTYPINAALGTLAANNYSFAFASGTLTVTQASIATTTIATSSIASSVYGQAVTLVAQVVSGVPGLTPTGTVVFYNGSTAIGSSTLSAAIATFTTSTLAFGSHQISMAYLGNGPFLSSRSSSITETVSASFTATTLVVQASASRRGFILDAKAIPVVPGGGTPTGSIIFSVNGKAFRRVSLVNGQAQWFVTTQNALRKWFGAAYKSNTQFFKNSISNGVYVTRSMLKPAARVRIVAAAPLKAQAVQGKASTSVTHSPIAVKTVSVIKARPSPIKVVASALASVRNRIFLRRGQ